MIPDAEILLHAHDGISAESDGLVSAATGKPRPFCRELESKPLFLPSPGNCSILAALRTRPDSYSISGNCSCACLQQFDALLQGEKDSEYYEQ